MKKNGGWLVAYALEQIGAKYTFGIPGAHTTEVYDALSDVEAPLPVLVTSEFGASFMADGLSRTSDQVGVLTTVPAAGTTHAASGICEAMLDGSPMLVISGGIRRDIETRYQLHDLDQRDLTKGMVKKYFLVERHQDIVSTIYEAYDLALYNEPGPTFVEVPADILLFAGEVGELKPYVAPERRCDMPDLSGVSDALALLTAAKKVGIYVGWGARKAEPFVAELAELLQAPVATTMQGLSAYPATHPWFTGYSFGRSAVPAAENAFKDIDCLLAVGVRFAEIGTAFHGMQVPEDLIHIDINPEVFSANYPAKVAMKGDASEVLSALVQGAKDQALQKPRNVSLKEQIAKDRKDYLLSWVGEPQKDKVSPGRFYQTLREMMPDDTMMVVDDGNHTFLTAELWPVHKTGHYLAPTDYNAMGFCVPAAIGAKLANPDIPVVGIVGDGAVLMSGLEMLTAATQKAGVMMYIFHDGELAQISQIQHIPMNRKTCSVLEPINMEGLAITTGAAFLRMHNDGDIQHVIAEAKAIAAQNKPVFIDVNIDYSRKTRFTKGVVKTNLSRFATSEKLRFVGRALKRHTFG